MRRTLILAGLLSIAFGYSAISIYGQSDPREQELVILFASLAAIGCAYGLTSFPAAARLPLLLFALPLAVRLAASGVPAHAGVGISLALITLMILRLVNLHNEGFVQLVRSRSEVETERERAQRAEQAALAEKARVRLVADTDPLTGLANRRAFLAELEQRLAAPAAVPAFALALLDLDGFKPINDTFGHAAGDALLIEVAARLRREAGAGALAARIGGDEFGLILPCANEAAADADRRTGLRRARAALSGRRPRVPHLRLLRPHLARARRLRRDHRALPGRRRALQRQAIRARLRRLVHAGDRRGEPAADRDRAGAARAGRDRGDRPRLPADLRPRRPARCARSRRSRAGTIPTLGPIAPAEFIPITEQINVIEQISDSLLARACGRGGMLAGAVRLSFNLSAIQLCSRDQRRAAARHRRRRSGLEPTPAADRGDRDGDARSTSPRRGSILSGCGRRARGSLLDDFGAGFASISYLREIMFDAIKLDGALVRGAPEFGRGGTAAERRARPVRLAPRALRRRAYRDPEASSRCCAR